MQVCVQAELQRKYELLAQLEEKYGEDGDRFSAPAPASTQSALTWQAVGDLAVEVIEAEGLNTSRQNSRLVMQRVRTSARLSMQGRRGKVATKATAWCTGQAPVWNEKLVFERRSRDDTLLLQVGPSCSRSSHSTAGTVRPAAQCLMQPKNAMRTCCVHAA